jgi:hypothetical protein
MPAASLSVCAGIAADKSLALAGEASVIIEHRHTVDPRSLAQAAQAWIDSSSSVSPAIGAGSVVGVAVPDAVEVEIVPSPEVGLVGSSERDGGPEREAGGGVGCASGGSDTDGSGSIPPRNKGES